MFQKPSQAVYIPLSVNEDESKQQARLASYQQLLYRMFGSNFECVPIAGGFSGSSVVKITPFDSLGNREESVVVKLDSAHSIRTEVAHSMQAQIALGDIAARILGEPIYILSEADGNEYGGFKMELAGAVLQVPELSSVGSDNLPMINTFKDLLLFESEEAVLSHLYVPQHQYKHVVIELHIDGGEVSSDEEECLTTPSTTVHHIVQLEGCRPFGSVPAIIKELFGQDGSATRSLRRFEESATSVARRVSKSDPSHPIGSEFLISRLPSELAPSETSLKVIEMFYALRGSTTDAVVPNPYEAINDALTDVKARLHAQLPRAWRLVRGFCHGDLNGSNIIIDATDGMWLIDFATARKLPLSSDLGKLESCILFEYCFVPIPLQYFVKLGALVDTSLLARWLRVKDVVIRLLLDAVSESTLTELDLDRALVRVAEAGDYAACIRSLRARIVISESAFWNGIEFGQSDLIKTFLPTGIPPSTPPLVDPTTSCVGTASLAFGLASIAKMRRYCFSDIQKLFRSIQDEETVSEGIGGLFNCDVSALEFAIVLLRETARVVRYEDVPPWTKIIAGQFGTELARVVGTELDRLEREGLCRAHLEEPREDTSQSLIPYALDEDGEYAPNGSCILEEEGRKYLKFVKSKYGFLVDFISGKQLDVTGHCCQFKLVAVDSSPSSPMALVRASSTPTPQAGALVSLDHMVRDASFAKPGSSFQFLIRGIPGSGKSCLLRRVLAEAVASGGGGGIVPLFVPVVEWARILTIHKTTHSPECKLDLYLRTAFTDDSPRLDFIRVSISTRRVVILVDGLDDADESILEEIQECLLNKAGRGIRVIVTYKTDSLSDTARSGFTQAGFVEAELAPLDADQRRFVVKARLGASRGDLLQKFESFYSGFEASVRGTGEVLGEGLIRSPAFLSMMICFWQQQDEAWIPNLERMSTYRGVDEPLTLSRSTTQQSTTSTSVADVYRVAISVLVHRFQMFQETDRSRVRDRAKALLELLRSVAFRMKCAHVEEMSDADVRKWNIDGEGWRKLTEQIRLGKLLILSHTISNGDFVYQFTLTGLVDFLAAEFIIHHSDGPDALAPLPPLSQLVTDSWWISTISILVEKAPGKYVRIVEQNLSAWDQTRSPGNDSILHVAARAGHLPVFKILTRSTLVESFIDKPNAASLLPLHEAARSGNPQMCQLLIAAKADVWATTADGWCALHYAASCHNREVCSALLADSRRSNMSVTASFNQLPQLPRQQLSRLSNSGLEMAGKILSKSISSKEFIATAKHVFPELSYFRGRSDTTPDASASVNLEPAEIEYRRTIGAMLSVFWIVSDNYSEFVSAQPEGSKLTPASWEWIRRWAVESVKLTTPESVDAMLCLMAIHDLGKLKGFRDDLAPDYKDHDAAMKYIISTTPEVLPSLSRLSDEYQYMVRTTMTVDFNFGQFLQSENVPANLASIKSLVACRGEESLAFYLFHIFVDMAGIAGAITLGGSLFMTETMYSNFKLGNESLTQLATRSPVEVYDAFLTSRSQAQGLSMRTPEDRAVVRLACLARVFDPVGGAEVKAAWDSLSDPIRRGLTDHLSRDGGLVDENPAILIYYAPAFMDNCRKNKLIGLVKAMEFLYRIYEAAETEFREPGNGVVVVHVAEAAEIAKKSNPHMFESVCFQIVKSGGTQGLSEGTLRVSPWRVYPTPVPPAVPESAIMDFVSDLPCNRDALCLTTYASMYPEIDFLKSVETPPELYDECSRSVLVFSRIVSGKFDAFGRTHPGTEKLSKRLFTELVGWVSEQVAHPAAMDAVFVLLTVSKMAEIRQLLVDLGESDECMLIRLLANHPSVFPSFDRLSTQWRRVVLNCLAVPVEFDRILCCECLTPASFASIAKLNPKDELPVWLVYSLVSLASSAPLTESVYCAFRKLVELIPAAELDEYLRYRGENQGLFGSHQMASPKSGSIASMADGCLAPEGVALIRIACLARVYFPTGGSVVQGAYLTLPVASRQTLVRFFTDPNAVEMRGLADFLTACKSNTNIGLDSGLVVLVSLISQAGTTAVDISALATAAASHALGVPFQTVQFSVGQNGHVVMANPQII